MWSGNSPFSIHGVSYGVSHSEEGISRPCVTSAETIRFVRKPLSSTNSTQRGVDVADELFDDTAPRTGQHPHTILTCGSSTPAHMCSRGQIKFRETVRFVRYHPETPSELGMSSPHPFWQDTATATREPTGQHIAGLVTPRGAYHGQAQDQRSITPVPRGAFPVPVLVLVATNRACALHCSPAPPRHIGCTAPT
ncbi:Uncharacterised protein [Mycobacteroides abscessus subsp. massiliense]|nr:Uncharacterised protein [Mycobacteroides abscessus subsp. massiliense]